MSMIPPEKQKQIFGHPTGLFVLFFSEMWERMSYYGMRALLVLYMLEYLFADPARKASVLGFSFLESILTYGFGPMQNQGLSSHVYGLYTGFVYLSPFFGGILADKIWGKTKSVYVGGALMAFGHFLMAFEGLFLPALFFIILGNGSFKPNISTQVGSLYKQGDPRRDGAFTIFYMGINIGAFFSPFICKVFATWLCAKLEIPGAGAPWHLGFALAGVGMVLGMVIFHAGRKYLPAEDPSTLAPVEERRGILLKTFGGLLGIMIGFMVFLMLPTPVKVAVVVLLLAGIAWSVSRIQDADERQKVAALVVVFIGTIFFWAIFEQQGNTLQLWASEKADWARLNLQAEVYQSFNPGMIFVMAPLLDIWWKWNANKGRKTTSTRKMAIACFLAGSAFLVIPLATSFITPEKSLVNLTWLALTTLVFTFGELYLSPIGLSLVTKVAPERLVSMLMGGWFISSFLGGYLAGYMGSLYEKMSETSFFLMFSVMGALIGIFFLVIEGRLTKMIGKDV